MLEEMLEGLVVVWWVVVEFVAWDEMVWSVVAVVLVLFAN